MQQLKEVTPSTALVERRRAQPVRTTAQLPASTGLVRRSAPRQPVVVDLVNGLSRALPVRRRRLVELNPWRLMERAERQTGFNDWGSLEFVGAFDRLIDSLNKDAELSPFGSYVISRQLIGALETRLRIQRELNRNPAILEQQIRRPMFVLGLPRTGSTLLQRLLSQDPEVRPLLGWESVMPTPIEGDFDNSLRIAEASRRIRLYNWLCPELRHVHEVVPTEPEECTMLLQNSLMSASFGGMAKVPSYVQWLKTQDRRKAYQDYRLQLQILQSQRGGGRWMLKSPVHLWTLPELVDTFPDACIIQTHRSPANVVPSYCSLVAIRRSLGSRNVDMHELGEGVLQILAQMTEDALEARPALGEQHFFDVSYRALTADPFKLIEQIYAHFDLEFKPAARAAMQKWLDEHPQHKHGAHRYSPEQYGLSEARITEVLHRYHERYGHLL